MKTLQPCPLLLLTKGVGDKLKIKVYTAHFLKTYNVNK